MDFGAWITLGARAGFGTTSMPLPVARRPASPYAAWISEAADPYPCSMSARNPKGFGRDAQIEGDFHEGQRILLVEDLTTDGASKVKFCQALRTAGAEVAHTFVVFYYDIFPQTREKLAENGVAMHSLATWWDVIRVAHDMGHFDDKSFKTIEDFLNNPMEWSAAHGGASSFGEKG